MTLETSAPDWMRVRADEADSTAAPTWWFDGAIGVGDIIWREGKAWRVIDLTDTHVEVEEVEG